MTARTLNFLFAGFVAACGNVFVLAQEMGSDEMASLKAHEKSILEKFRFGSIPFGKTFEEVLALVGGGKASFMPPRDDGPSLALSKADLPSGGLYRGKFGNDTFRRGIVKKYATNYSAALSMFFYRCPGTGEFRLFAVQKKLDSVAMVRRDQFLKECKPKWLVCLALTVR